MEPVETSFLDTGAYEVTQAGGEVRAVVVPHHDFRRLGNSRTQPVLRPGMRPKLAAAAAELDEWEASGRPGAKSHDELMTELFGTTP
ncbi:hypothetical protein [Actinomadura sp. 6N118]|uniref:hypothetical protein n=1 Tax=Actinomadura sp. 6N118 TaxID=3375151 RepID=UPI0037ABF087